MRRHTLRPAPLALAIALAFGAAAVHAQGAGPPGVPVQIAIKAQPLAQALNDWARQTRTQLIVQQGLVSGKSAPAVSGTLTPAQALERLLAGSGLVAVPEGNAIVIKAAPAGPTGSLETVTVTAQTERDGTTEGSGSYRATATSTATKLALSPRETPQTLSVVTRQQMEDFAMTTVDQALHTTSGVIVNDQASSQYFYSRGFEMQLQYDGVANPSGISNDYSPSIDSAFIDRVEVLQGAAGLLTGAGRPGGTINLIRKRPTEAFQAQAEVQLGAWNQKRIVGDVAGPLVASGRIRGRLVAVIEDKDSFIDYTYLKRQGVYGAIDADVSPTTKLSASFQYQHDKSRSDIGIPMAADGSDLGLRRSAFFGDPRGSILYTYALYSAALEQQLSASWKAKFSVQHAVNNQYLEKYGFLAGAVDPATGEGLGFYGGSDYKNPCHYDAFDLSVTGPVTLFGRTHELAFGASHSDWKSPQDGSMYSFDGHALNAYTFDPASLPEFTPAGTYANTQNTRQTGAYAVGRFALTDALKAIAGLRASWYKAGSAYSNSLGARGGSEQSESGVLSPYAGLTYDVNSAFTAYASYSDIFTPSTYKGTNGYLKPVVGKNYEVGIKGELLEKRVNMAAALFHLEQVNLARQDNAVPYDATNVCGGYCYTAADKVVSQGVDLSAYGEIHPGWNVAASYTYVDSKYASGADDGQRFKTDLPRHSLRVAVNHRLAGTGWTLGASLRAQSGIYATDATWTLRQGGYALAGLTAKYAIDPQTDVLLAAENLFDRRYYASVYSPNYMRYGTPRAVTATLRHRF